MGNSDYLYRLFVAMIIQFPDAGKTHTRKKRKLLNANKRVGNTIKNYRTDKDLSQRELADKANEILDKIGTNRIPDKSAISRIESGGRELKYLESLAISKVLGVHPEELWKERSHSILSVIPNIKNYPMAA